MSREKFFLSTIAALFLFNGISFSQFIDDFELYIPNQQLACQNPIDWTTWTQTPCEPTEDPYISTNHSYSGTKSVRIIQYNELVKPLGNKTSGLWIINFKVYIPIGKDGYFCILNTFPISSSGHWAMEIFFDQGGTGRLLNGNTYTFSWTANTWQFVEVVIDLYLDQAQFWFNGSMVDSWQWTRGNPGYYALRLAANDFYGPFLTSQIFIDDYTFFHSCLSCHPPNAPSNLTAQEIFNPDPKVQLNWQDNSIDEYAFNVIRKNGLLFGPGRFLPIGTTSGNITVYFDSTVVVDSTYTYGVVAYNEYGFSDTSNFATITVEPVPVELTSFTGIANNGAVELNWTTATETNNQMFEIQRQSSGSEFTTIGFVSGHGTTTETQQYNYVDRTVSTGIYSYTLKQIDFDGTYEYSDVVEVDVQAPLEFALDQNYPNPFNPVTNIRFQIVKQGLVSIKVYDLLGKEVAILVNEEKEAGNYEVEFDASFLSSGMYIYKLTSNDFSSSRKMLLMK